MQMHALGQDPYWLTAIKKAASGQKLTISTTLCSGDPAHCIQDLPQPGAESLLVLDAYQQSGLQELVRALRACGWRYVIVVAADPSAKEAISVLRGNLGYDYWQKTYEIPEIQLSIATCLSELAGDIGHEGAAARTTGQAAAENSQDTHSDPREPEATDEGKDAKTTAAG